MARSFLKNIFFVFVFGIFFIPVFFFFREEKTVHALHPKKKIEISRVPFTTQAPFGRWEDPQQQHGCEEASLLMVMKWITNKPLDAATAEREILVMSEFEKKRYGFYEDTSAEQTVQLLKDYFGYTNATVKKNISKADIIEALEEGEVVIVPAQGQLLKNPHFKGAGPERHMLVVYGYDLRKKEFITNDPGTRKGKGYRYKEDVLFGALLNYPSGKHVPITKRETAMIRVKKK